MVDKLDLGYQKIGTQDKKGSAKNRINIWDNIYNTLDNEFDNKVLKDKLEKEIWKIQFVYKSWIVKWTNWIAFVDMKTWNLEWKTWNLKIWKIQLIYDNWLVVWTNLYALIDMKTWDLIKHLKTKDIDIKISWKIKLVDNSLFLVQE